MPDRLSPRREAEIATAVAVYANHPMIGFNCCSAHPVADAVSELLAELAAVRRERDEVLSGVHATEWGVRFADGRVVPVPSNDAAREDAADYSEQGRPAVAVSRPAVYGEWAEAAS